MTTTLRGGTSQRLLDTKNVPPESPLRKLHLIVNPILFAVQVFGQRIEEVERVEDIPRHRRHVPHAKASVRDPQLGTRVPGDHHEVRALLDANELRRRRGSGGGEHELSRAGPHTENAPSARVPQAVRGASSDRHGRPKEWGEQADSRRVNGIEDGIVGNVRLARSHRASSKAANVPARIGAKNRPGRRRKELSTLRSRQNKMNCLG